MNATDIVWHGTGVGIVVALAGIIVGAWVRGRGGKK